MPQQRLQKPVRKPDRLARERQTDQDSKERPEVRQDIFERWFKER